MRSAVCGEKIWDRLADRGRLSATIPDGQRTP